MTAWKEPDGSNTAEEAPAAARDAVAGLGVGEVAVTGAQSAKGLDCPLYRRRRPVRSRPFEVSRPTVGPKRRGPRRARKRFRRSFASSFANGRSTCSSPSPSKRPALPRTGGSHEGRRRRGARRHPGGPDHPQAPQARMTVAKLLQDAADLRLLATTLGPRLDLDYLRKWLEPADAELAQGWPRSTRPNSSGCWRPGDDGPVPLWTLSRRAFSPTRHRPLR